MREAVVTIRILDLHRTGGTPYLNQILTKREAPIVYRTSPLMQTIIPAAKFLVYLKG